MSIPGVVYVIDDDPSICDLVTASLQPIGLTVKTYPSAEAFAGTNMIADAAGLPFCLLLDLAMPGLSGLEFLATRFNGRPPCPVIIVTAKGTVESAVKAMKLGAVEFIEKPFTPESLAAVVVETMKKQREICSNCAKREAARARLAMLSPREAELLAAIVQGQSTKMIADRLGISARTVDHHRANLMDKMCATNVADVVRMAVEADYHTIDRHKPPAAPDLETQSANG